MSLLIRITFVFALSAALIAGSAFSPDNATAESATEAELEAVREQMRELERRLEILTDEVRKQKEERRIPEAKPLESEHGLGRGASKVYSEDERRVSIGGYGEFSFVEQMEGGDADTFDFGRFIVYLGYKFNDWIVLNSELEFEHASTSSNNSSGSVSVEFAYLDFLLHEKANVRAGLVLIPVGFINELHEPPFFHGNDRPAVERQLIPTTWRQNGIGLFGELMPGLRYRTYVVTSLRGEKFKSSNIRSGRQKGNREEAEDFSWVGRLDYSPKAGLDFSVSAFLGDQGQDADFMIARDAAGNPTATTKADAFMQMYEAHASWQHRGFEIRALGVYTKLDDADVLSLNAEQAVGDEMLGWYVETAFNVMPHLPWTNGNTDHYLAPWIRYSQYDTNHSVASGFARNPNVDREDIEVGLTYKPISEVVLKLDYRHRDSAGADVPDEVRLGAGFVF